MALLLLPGVFSRIVELYDGSDDITSRLLKKQIGWKNAIIEMDKTKSGTMLIVNISCKAFSDYYLRGIITKPFADVIEQLKNWSCDAWRNYSKISLEEIITDLIKRMQDIKSSLGIVLKDSGFDTSCIISLANIKWIIKKIFEVTTNIVFWIVNKFQHEIVKYVLQVFSLIYKNCKLISFDIFF